MKPSNPQGFPFETVSGLAGGIHCHADRFHRPEQLAALCRDAGLDVQRTIGYEPASAGALILSLQARRRGRITDHELATRAGFALATPGHMLPVTYYLLCRRRFRVGEQPSEMSRAVFTR